MTLRVESLSFIIVAYAGKTRTPDAKACGILEEWRRPMRPSWPWLLRRLSFYAVGGRVER